MKGVSRESWPPFLVAGWLVTALSLGAVFGGCSDEDGSHAPSAEVGFRFGIRGDDDASEDFVALTSDGGIISVARWQLALPDSERTLHISGRIERGGAGHNLGWAWHFVPGEWALTGSSAELCDAIPQAVEDDLDYWVDTVQSFCPWDSYVKQEISQAQQD